MFVDDLGDAKVTITELTRRLHEFELEVRRLENERDELTAAYKEAEAVSCSFPTTFFSENNLTICRVVKPRNNALNVCPPNWLNSVTKPRNVSPKRMKKLKPSGKFVFFLIDHS